jgi:CTP:molybdopterin cytidylyltransferase MocA
MPTSNQHESLTAVVLAGDRKKTDPLISESVAGCKALIEVDGQTMLSRVLKALQGSAMISDTVLTGPERAQLDTDADLVAWMNAHSVQWRPPGLSPSTSAYETMTTLPAGDAVLLTTCDHPLLTSTMVDAFTRQSLAEPADVVVGLAPYAIVQQAYPDMKKTVLRFSDGEFCSCNLFAFLTPEGRGLAEFWRAIEQQRKKPLRVIGLLGWRAVIRYRLGLLSLEEALARLGKRLGLRLRAVVLPYADAAIDVDSIADLHAVRDSLANR